MLRCWALRRWRCPAPRSPRRRQCRRFYIGAEIGQGDAGEEDDIGYKFLGGYQFYRNFAAEVGYGILVDKGDVEVTTLELVGVGMFPLGNNFLSWASSVSRLGV